MPKKNGLEALGEIMRLRPTPVVMVSSLTKEGADVTIQALALGAVDFVGKPSGTISLDMAKVGEELRQKVLIASSVNRVAAFRRLPSMPSRPTSSATSVSPSSGGPVSSVGAPRPISPAVFPPPSGRRPTRAEAVLIAASTGGPRALQEVIPLLPGDFPLPVLVVQHMPRGFTASFAQRLDDMSLLEVVEGFDGLKVRKGMAVIAPGGYHMILERTLGDLTCRLSDAPPLRSVKPAADMLFLSAADLLGGALVAAVLTGMGRDGTDGARAIHDRGGYVVAEAPETCVVYGMPRSVVEAGVADELLPLGAIPGALVRLTAI
jgi:two-component system chemotaxis response regulator CheB